MIQFSLSGKLVFVYLDQNIPMGGKGPRKSLCAFSGEATYVPLSFTVDCIWSVSL